MAQYSPPFPGMDPYLEEPDIWPDFHQHSATVMGEMLNAQLPYPYYARLQMRPELGVVLEAGSLHRIMPDVVVSRTLRDSPGGWGGATVVSEPRTQVTEGVQVRIRTDPLRHQFVEIRDVARGHKLVTLIEIASPSNKRPGPDRRAHEAKQREVLESDANLIELDLLRSGRRLLPYPELEEAVDDLACDYLIQLNRAATRQDTWMDYTLYPVHLREPLPCIPVPLAIHDPDVPLDFQVMVNRVYLSGPYARAVDYTHDPEPPLREEDRVWADRCLKVAGLRLANEGT